MCISPAYLRNLGEVCENGSMTETTHVATLHTNHGAIKINLFGKHAPVTVANFVGLADGTKTGKRFYDGLIFHRIIDGFMIQGGCPTGTGTGGPGYTFQDEPHDELHYDRKYQIAMANAGPGFDGSGTNGSQFFITTSEPEYLWGKHTIFGEVADDASKRVVDKISAVPTDMRDRPLEDVELISVDIEKL
jgi:peptidyl-prolyl cis-trans isomerase A (cyclophilin A)